MTNLEDTGSVLSAETVIEIAKHSSSTLHIVTTDLVFEAMRGWRTRRDRLSEVSCGAALLCSPRSHFWKPGHEREFDHPPAIAEATGGRRHVPDPLINRNAAIFFEKLYDDHRRSYRLRYTPKDVAREGWHAVSVTVPKYPSYAISARPGYAVEGRR